MIDLVVTDPSELGLVDAELRDATYDVEGLAFDDFRQQLVLPFLRPDQEQARLVKRGPISRVEELPLYRWYLRIDGVLSYEVAEQGQPAFPGGNAVRFDPTTGSVIVEGNTSTDITARVERLRVRVEQTAEPRGTVRRKTGRLFGITWQGESMNADGA